MAIFKTNAVGILIYVIIVVVLLAVLFMEYKDINCKTFKDGPCGPGNGRAYAAGKPHKDDDFETLIEKAKHTANYESNSIFWRRAFIAAAVSSFLILFILKSRVPSGITWGYSLMIIYIVMYLTLTLFQKWVSKPALKQMDHILEKLKSKYHHDSS